MGKAAIVAAIVVVVFGFGGTALWSTLAPTTVAARRSPDGRHEAVLRRFEKIDVNFQLLVDDEKVFWSADFAPVALDFREAVAWDRSGRRVVVAVADQRLFAYDAEAKRPLSAAELLALDLPPFSEFRFEGDARGRWRRSLAADLTR